MKSVYCKPEAKRITFNYEKIVAASPDQCRWESEIAVQTQPCFEEIAPLPSTLARCGWVSSNQ